MTKKDYVRIARALHRCYKLECETPAEARLVERAGVEIADELKADNGSFSRDRFMKAVRTGEGIK